ncbi:hypothetical protein [Sporosarcina saromensis]|nr:hypothetical protein [Sporosarcina saromensis]
MSEPLESIKKLIEKNDSHIYEINIHDTNENKDYIVRDIDDIEEFTSVFNSLKDTIVTTNKKGVLMADSDYNIIVYFGEYDNELGEYTVKGAIYLYVNVENEYAFRILVPDHPKIEINGELKMDSVPFANPIIGYVVDKTKNHR